MGDYAGLTVQGEDRFDDLGIDVSNAGDINGDGIDDFIVGARYARYDPEGQDFTGVAYVIFGTTDGPATLNVADIDGQNGFRITPEGDERIVDSPYGYSYDIAPSDYGFGTFVAGVGDINGDGVDDVAVAGPTRRYTRYAYGEIVYDQQSYSYSVEESYQRPNFIYVIFGKDTAVDGDFAKDVAVGDLDGDNGFKVDGVFGIVNDVSSAGDVNGDGLGDLLISQSPVPAYSGYGGYGGYAASVNAEVLAVDAQAALLAGDGAYQGFVILGDEAIGAGGVFDAQNLDGSNGFAIQGERGQDFFRGGEGGFYGFDGGGVISLGDVNGDGFDDLGVRRIVGTVETYTRPNNYGGNNYYTNYLVESRAFILFGADDSGTAFDPVVDPAAVASPSNPAGQEVFWNTFSFTSDGFYDNATAAGIGDINGDGFDDIGVGDPNRTLADFYFGNSDGERAIGVVSIYFGGPDGVVSGRDDTGVNASGSQTPTLPDPALDPDADPAPDFSDPANRVPNPNLADVLIVSTDNRFDFFGGTIAGVGDINGDGVDDFAIGAERQVFFNEYQEGGEVFLVFGDTTLPQDAPTIIDLDNLSQPEVDQTFYRFIGADEFDLLGSAISAAGDVNNDGFQDFIIGAREADVEGNPFGGASSGEAYVVFGGTAALEAADNADGANDNVINVQNLGVNVETGVLPVEVSVRDAGFFSIRQSEGDAGATIFGFEVQRTGDLSELVSFDFQVSGFGGNAANGADFVGGALPGGTASFVNGEAIATVEIAVQGDFAIEATEDFSFSISNATTDGGSPISITADETFGRIFNDDFPVRFRIDNASVTEGDVDADNRELVFNVRRSGEVDVAASVDFEIQLISANAADFEAGVIPSSGALNFAAGETLKTIVLPIDEDVDIEGNESVFARLSNAAADLGVATEIQDGFAQGTIFNDDFPPRIQVIGPGSRFEGNSPGGLTPFTFTIERLGDTNGITDVTFDINPFPSPGNFFAADSNDVDGFLPSFGNTVRFEDGESQKFFTVNVNHDGVIEPRESFELRIIQVNALNGVNYDIFRPSATATILNDDGRPPVIPPGVEADVFGDPHIVTLDGLGYDFQAVGEYILVETEAGAANPFQVQVRFEPLPGSDLVSVTTRMAVEIGAKTVEIDALGADPLLIDGVAPTAEDLARGAIDVDGDGTPDVFFDATLGLFTIVLNGENEQLIVKNAGGALNVCVFLADSADGNAGGVRGLMGDGDSDGTADDLALRDGTVLAQPLDFDKLYGDFADSWRIDGTAGKAALFSNTAVFPAGFPAAAITLADLPADLVELAKAAALAAGLDPVNDPEIFESAVLDFALTGDDTFFEGALGLAADVEETTEPGNAPALPATISVTPGETSITEGDAGSTSALFTFFRIGDTSGELTVDFAVGGSVDAADLAAGTAFADSVTFGDGANSASISVDVLGDLTSEADETLTVTITGVDVAGALVAGPKATTKILTDDFAPEAADDEFSTDEDTRVEGNLLDGNPDILDDDADGDTLTVTRVFDADGTARSANGGLFILDSGAHLKADADGAFTYDPFGFTVGIGAGFDTFFDRLDTGEIGIQTFSYEIADGNGGFDTAAVAITVRGIDDAPIGVVDAITLTEDDVSGGVNVLDGSISPDVDPEGGDLIVKQIKLGSTVVDVDAVDGATINLDGGGRIEINQAGDAEFFTEGAFEDLGDAPGQLVQKNINFTYTVMDEGGLTDDVLLQVFVKGVNDAPEILDDAFSIDENTTAVGVVGAFDAEGDELSFAIDPFGVDGVLGGGDDLPDGDLFDIDAATGALSFIAPPDFENPADVGEDNVYNIAVQVFDGTAAVTQEIAVTVNDVNEAPVILDAAFEVEENSTFVGTVGALDEDDDDLTFSLAEVVIVGAPLGDGGFFEIDEDTGDLSFIAPPNFEAPLDEDGDNVYEVGVNVFDGALTTTETVLVRVVDVNDAPSFISDDTFDVAENTTFVGVVAAQDEDIGDELSFAIDPFGVDGVLGGGDDLPDGDLFDIDVATGALSFIAPPDFENPADVGEDNVYNIAVRVFDGTEAVTQEIAVTVTDVEEEIFVLGTPGRDNLFGTDADETFQSFGGSSDVINLGAGGSDIVLFGDETANNARERDVIFDFGLDDFLDLGGAEILREINRPTLTLLQLSGDGDLVYLVGVSDFDQSTQLINAAGV